MARTEIARGFAKLLREQYPSINVFDTKYLRIDEKNNVIISSYPYDLESADLVIVICLYTYTVITQQSSSCFFLFLDKQGHKDDYLMINDWKIFFDLPTTSLYHTNCRTCNVTNGKLCVSFNLSPIYDMAIQIQRVWPYLMEATKCTSQKELDFLSSSFRMNMDIEKLKEKNLELEYRLSVEQERIYAYQALLDKIETIVEKNNSERG